jgi:hypothetical protein
MRTLFSAVLAITLARGAACAQDTFVVTGTAIPAELLKLNYGSLPASVRAFDLSICNASANKQSVVSSEIYQALAKSNAGLQPIGRQIMLAAILRNQNHSVASILNLILNSATGVLSVLGAAKTKLPPGVLAGAALGSLSAQQLITNLRPVLTADQVEKFENQVLEPALVLDGGSCAERTVFASTAEPKQQTKSLSFHLR